MDYSKNSIKFLDLKGSKNESGNTLCTSLFTNQLTPTSAYMLHHATDQFIKDLYLVDKQSE